MTHNVMWKLNYLVILLISIIQVGDFVLIYPKFLNFDTEAPKGQLNSELIYGDINFPKQQQKCCEDICPDIFLQRPGSFLGLSGDLVSNIIINESYRKPKEASRAEILTLFIFVAILENRCHYKFILSLTNLYLEKHL